MNFTSQICTTKEQSERLLTFGLRKETADCILVENPFKLNSYVMFPIVDIDETLENEMCDEPIPAWSLHRLIEMYTKHYVCEHINLKLLTYDTIIENIRLDILTGTFNKDYLKQ